MIAGLKKNKFTQTLATGAAALGVLAGVGLAGAPAQASQFVIQGGLPTVEPGAVPRIWPEDTSGWDSHPCPAGVPVLPEDCTGNPNVTPVTVKVTGNPFERKKLIVDYKGSDAAFSNFFDLDGIHWATGPSLTNDKNPGITYTNVGKFTGDNWAWPGGDFGARASIDIELDAMGMYVIPFMFTTNSGTPGNAADDVMISNGEFCTPGALDCHFFATYANAAGQLGANISTDMVGVGFSDRPLPDDEDTQDFVVKFSLERVPEPGTVLGLLAVGGLGAFMKRKKQG